MIQGAIEQILPDVNPRFEYSVGVDLGRSKSRTVIVCVQTKVDNGEHVEHYVNDVRVLPTSFDFREQIATIRGYRETNRLFRIWGIAHFAVDASGVGAPISEELKRQHVRHTPVVITPGDSRNRSDGKLKVGRNRLFTILQKMLFTDNFFINPSLEYANQLRRELASVTQEFTDNGEISFKTGEQDDILFALMLALLRFDIKRKRVTTFSPF